jgi:2-polyprenyl-3-methyl-5-hydroxy-6-metoxy-1,4-benzoquinol methylase
MDYRHPISRTVVTAEAQLFEARANFLNARADRTIATTASANRRGHRGEASVCCMSYGGAPMANWADYAIDGSYGRGGPLPHHRHIVPAIVRLLPSQKPLRILDVGCGNGYVDNILAKLGHEVTGVDFDAEAIEVHKRAYPLLDARLHDAQEPLAAICPSADMVLAVEVIEHIYRPARFLEAARGALRPGGHVLLTTPYHGYLKNLAVSLVGRWDHIFTVEWEEGHIKFFSESSMRRMLTAAGFDDIVFGNAGRLPYLWKTLVVRARKAR